MADVWQNARAQIASYEHRTSELQLTLATEKEALEAVLREVKKLDDERASLSSKAAEAEAKAAAEQRVLEEARAAADRAAKDTSVLNKHLELLRAGGRDIAAQLESDRRRYREHLSELRSQLAAYQAHLEGGAAAAGQ